LHLRVVASALGLVVAAGGAVMLVPLVYGLIAGDGTLAAFGVPAAVASTLGVGLFLLTRKHTAPYVSVRDVFLIVVLGWFGVASVGAMPFWISGLMSPTDAFFEAMAGFTTTGATTVATPEDVASSLLLWRSLSQWVGGIGIVVLFVAVGPLVGFGAAQLYSAEIANPVPERLTPRISDTAKILAYVYAGLTISVTAALLLAAMESERVE
jgi:trk system potassium uptake protein